MLPYMSAKISVRLPPTANPEECKNFIIKTLTENPPYNAKVTILNAAADYGFNNSEYPEIIKASITEAS